MSDASRTAPLPSYDDLANDNERLRALLREADASLPTVRDGTDTGFMAGGGEMGALMRAMEWSQTAFGPVNGWSQALRADVSICLTVIASARENALATLRLLTIALSCVLVIAATASLADIHPAKLRSTFATTTGVKLKLLLEQCNATADDDMSANFCTGYIAASFDQLSLMQQICPPDRNDTKRIFITARKYLFGHADQMDKHPSWVLSQAFREAYPCTPK